MRGVTATHSISKKRINFPFHKEKNKMVKLDFSMIRKVRVPHQQFDAIKNKAKYLIVEDRDNGKILSFIRENDDKNTESLKANNKKKECRSCQYLISCTLGFMKTCKYKSRW